MDTLGIHDLWLFLLSGVLLNITPGPDTAYVLGRSAQFGWRGGAAAALGISAGCLVHVLAASIGLSALLMASSTAFGLIKWAGAAYLCYVGITMLLSRRREQDCAEAGLAPAMSPGTVFWQGALTNILNPKVALFFLAFLPQFVSSDAPHQAAAFALLGLIFITTGTAWCLMLAAFAARAIGRIRRADRATLWVNRALGSLFIYLGARIALLQAK